MEKRLHVIVADPRCPQPLRELTVVAALTMGLVLAALTAARASAGSLPASRIASSRCAWLGDPAGEPDGLTGPKQAGSGSMTAGIVSRAPPSLGWDSALVEATDELSSSREPRASVACFGGGASLAVCMHASLLVAIPEIRPPRDP